MTVLGDLALDVDLDVALAK